MVILTPGHKYVASNFENSTNGQTIQFIEKEQRQGETGTVLETVNDGTTTEELLAVLINRTKFLNDKFPCKENAMAITNMEQALMWLNERTSKRIQQGVEGKSLAHKD